MIRKRFKNCFAHVGAKFTCLVYEFKSEKGQGTTEYAILVGVLAVIAMIAIALFKDKISELWDAITSGVNDL